MNNIRSKASTKKYSFMTVIDNLPAGIDRLYERYEYGYEQPVCMIWDPFNMSRFEELELNVTVGNKYKPAIEIKTQEEADQYFEVLVSHCQRYAAKEGKEISRADAEVIERENIGYFSGYYDEEAQNRVFELYNTEHPLFGRAKPTSEQALQAGKMMAEGMKAGNSVEDITAEVRLAIGVDSAHEYMARKKERKKTRPTDAA